VRTHKSRIAAGRVDDRLFYGADIGNARGRADGTQHGGEVPDDARYRGAKHHEIRRSGRIGDRSGVVGHYEPVDRPKFLSRFEARYVSADSDNGVGQTSPPASHAERTADQSYSMDDKRSD
jgi:hypothetical protein